MQDFKETVDEETVPPGNVWVTDGDCPVPFAIGGGCIVLVRAALARFPTCDPENHIGHEPFLQRCEGKWPRSPPLFPLALC